MVLGAWLIYNKTEATGSIDLKSSFVNGKIESGSAGLFLCFFALILLTVSILADYQKGENLAFLSIFKGFRFDGLNPSEKMFRVLICFVILITSLFIAHWIIGFSQNLNPAYITIFILIGASLIGFFVALASEEPK